MDFSINLFEHLSPLFWTQALYSDHDNILTLGLASSEREKERR